MNQKPIKFQSIRAKTNHRTKKTTKVDLLGDFRALVDLASLFLALTLEVVQTVAMALPVKLDIISLRLKIANHTNNKDEPKHRNQNLKKKIDRFIDR